MKKQRSRSKLSHESAKREVKKMNQDEKNSLATGEQILKAYIVKNKSEGGAGDTEKTIEKTDQPFDPFDEWSVSWP